jgi:hypothetical protein
MVLALPRIRHKIANATEMPFCAPPTDRAKGIVPVHNGGSLGVA